MSQVFLSYSRRNSREVGHLRERLAVAGITFFLDRDRLTPGRPWQPELERALDDCSAVVVLVGRDGLGDWQHREVQVALDLQTRDESRLVIPVMLDGAEAPSRFLGLNTWIDLRNPDHTEDEYERLTRALSARGTPAQSAAPVLICPYRGLIAFREEDARFLFGRDRVINELERKVDALPVVAAVGASGSGKSSVVRAGLVSRLRRLDCAETWQIVTLTPTDRPLRALAAAFAPLLELGGTGDVVELKATKEIIDSLRTDDGALRDVVARSLKRDPGTTRILLVADQWEELYTLCGDREEADRFISQIIDATRLPEFRCVITVRGDFYGHILESRPLAEQLQDSIVNIGPMDRTELREVIERPAHAVGLRLEKGLVDRILADTGEEPGNLPLLQFLLLRLWQLDHDEGILSHQRYDELEGVHGGIAHRANEILTRKNDAEKKQLRRVFGRLVQPGEGVEDTRRRARYGEFAAVDDTLIRELVDARLLVVSKEDAATHEPGESPENASRTTIEVAHEALIRGWPVLRAWVDEDRELLAWLNRLAPVLAEWENSRHSADLLSGARLAEAEKWVRERKDRLAQEEIDFIERSAARRRRAAFLRLSAVVTFVVGLVVALWITLRALEEKTEATDPIVVKDLIERGRESWPRGVTREAALANLDLWLRDADPVIGRKTLYGKIAKRLLAGTSRRERMDEMLSNFAELEMLREEMPKRREHILEASWELWRESELTPQRGLLPLGRNAESGLWEFWFPISGSRPIWNRGSVQHTDDMAVVFVLVPGGRDWLGAQKNKKPNLDSEARSHESPVHLVTMPPFFLAKYEVTNAQWARLGAESKGRPGHPVVEMSWIEADDVLRSAGLSLPSEAQWEYACRAGTDTPFHVGKKLTKNEANIDGSETARVGLYSPNGFGLHDMHGNVWEWCQDFWHGDYIGAPADGSARPEGSSVPRVYRGGAFDSSAKIARSANRYNLYPVLRSVSIGIRPARNVDSK